MSESKEDSEMDESQEDPELMEEVLKEIMNCMKEDGIKAILKKKKPGGVHKLEEIGRLDICKGEVTCICLLKSGKIIVGTEKKEIGIITLGETDKEDELIGTISIHEGEDIYVAEFDDGRLLTCSSKEIRVWSIGEGEFNCLKTLYAFCGRIFKVIPLPNDAFASCSIDKTILIWKDYKVYKTLKGHKNYVLNMLLLSNKKEFVSGTHGFEEDQIIFWDANDYKMIKTIDGAGSCSPNAMCEYKDKLISTSGRAVFVISITNKQLLCSIKGKYYSFWFAKVFNDDVLLGNTHDIFRLDFDKSEVEVIETDASEADLYDLVQVSKDRFVTCSGDGTFSVWKLAEETENNDKE